MIFLQEGHLYHRPSGVSLFSLVEVVMPSLILLNQDIVQWVKWYEYTNYKRSENKSHNKRLGYRDTLVQVHILYVIQQFNAVFHGFLECFPAANQSLAAATLVNDSRGNCFCQVGGSFG